MKREDSEMEREDPEITITSASRRTRFKRSEDSENIPGAPQAHSIIAPTAAQTTATSAPQLPLRISAVGARNVP
eukprot:1379857-Pleurochrysis_carterae.AAC.1